MTVQNRTKFYDPDEVLIYAAGAIIVGYADGELISVEQVSDAFNDVVGSDGEIARSRSNDRRATVTVKLLQTSLSNLVFSAAHNKDLSSPNGAGVFTFKMQDLNGASIVEGDQAWIVKYPDASMDRTAKSREWPIRIGSVRRTEGGNA